MEKFSKFSRENIFGLKIVRFIQILFYQNAKRTLRKSIEWVDGFIGAKCEGFTLVKLKKKNLEPVVRKPINANPGLKVNRGLNFPGTKVFFAANVEGQKM